MQHYALQPSRPRAPKSFETRRGRVGNATEPTFCCGPKKSWLAVSSVQIHRGHRFLSGLARELIRSRVRSGLAVARAKGKRLGRPRKVVDVATVAALRARGVA
jgi:hypothetical protein